MKKSNLFLVLLTALIVMSCSKDETTMSIPQEGNAIEFGTYVGRDARTRASVTNIEALQVADVGFGVFAHYSGAAAYATPATTPNFMYNQQVKFADTKWEYTPVKYWPNNSGEKVSFFAFAPYGNANITIASAAVDPTLKFTVNGTVKEQADLVWGVNETGGLPFLNQTKQTIDGDIKFTFKHALARIGFNVQAMVDNLTTSEAIADETDIVVTKVELIGKFYASGALNLNNTTANVPLWVATVPGTERTFKLNAGTTSGNTNFKITDTKGVSPNGTFGQPVAKTQKQLNADDSYLMVIPQNFIAGSEVKIIVTYDVITADDKLETGQSKVTNVITSTPFVFDFVGGKAYTFNLHLGMTSVKFDASVSPWDETATDIVVNVPINTTTP